MGSHQLPEKSEPERFTGEMRVYSWFRRNKWKLKSNADDNDRFIKQTMN
jgi:hypothetical protein